MIILQCFHGTSYEKAKSILKEQHFRSGDSSALRMGRGAYFFCQVGDKSDYAKECARELEKYHFGTRGYSGEYAIVSCKIECEEDSFLDLYNPESLAYFHQMRYLMMQKSLEEDPKFKYQNAAVADTQVFNKIREIRNISAIRCPQFFGMLEQEQKFIFKERPQFPKTYVPNVIMVCADPDLAVIKDICIAERGDFDNGYEGVI